MVRFSVKVMEVLGKVCAKQTFETDFLTIYILKIPKIVCGLC